MSTSPVQATLDARRAEIDALVHDLPEPRDGDQAFDEPWQLRAFAIAVGAHEAGEFEWAAFQSALIDSIDCWEKSAGSKSDWSYYEHWVKALEMVLGAASEDRLFGVVEARRTADGVTVTTDDGSSGRRGWVSDVLGDVIDRTSASVVYGCGPMAMLRSVTDIATAHGAVAQVAVEESMACGVGVCMTCVMPVTGNDGVTRMVRSCVEGPVFRGDRVRWDAFGEGIGRVPDDALGAPRAGGH